MIEIRLIEVNGFGAAIRGMRNPMNSWENATSGASSAAGSRRYRTPI